MGRCRHGNLEVASQGHRARHRRPSSHGRPSTGPCSYGSSRCWRSRAGRCRSSRCSMTWWRTSWRTRASSALRSDPRRRRAGSGTSARTSARRPIRAGATRASPAASSVRASCPRGTASTGLAPWLDTRGWPASSKAGFVFAKDLRGTSAGARVAASASARDEEERRAYAARSEAKALTRRVEPREMPKLKEAGARRCPAHGTREPWVWSAPGVGNMSIGRARRRCA